MIASHILSQGDVLGGEMIEETRHRYSLAIMDRQSKWKKIKTLFPWSFKYLKFQKLLEKHLEFLTLPTVLNL